MELVVLDARLKAGHDENRLGKSLREIVLDTETTGLDPFDGHRVVEIGLVGLELLNRIPTGRVWHCHLNPEREVPYQAFEVHGLSTEFLRDKPRFAGWPTTCSLSSKAPCW